MFVPALFMSIFILIGVLVIGAPLQKQRQRATRVGASAGGSGRTASGYETTLLALRDLEFDHQMGVVSDGDYDRLRTVLIAQAAAELEGAQEIATEDVAGHIEAAIEARRRQIRQRRAAAVRFCTQCGRPIVVEDRFCISCGSPLKRGSDA